MEEKNVLLSVKDLEVKFNVRGRVLTAIRGISLDILENESIAIVGESGSGKSVFTKTFAGMLDGNGFISQGDVIFNDAELVDTVVNMNAAAWKQVEGIAAKLDQYSAYEHGAETYNALTALEEEKTARASLTAEENQKLDDEISELVFQRTEAFNLKQTYDPHNEKDKIKATSSQITAFDAQIKKLQQSKDAVIAQRKKTAAADTAYLQEYSAKKAELKQRYEEEIQKPVSEEVRSRNEVLAYEVYLSVGRYGKIKRDKCIGLLLKELRKAMVQGKDLSNDSVLNAVFDAVTFRVKYLDKTDVRLHGTCVINLAKVKDTNDWTQIRGKKIATVFQDPMTSLNPIITIGKQITSIILKHQQCSEVEARTRALELMYKVGIPNAEKRFDDYPFQYSGGMRQRIVIAIALSCQPKILICDEPTTALDVTIQAQILKLLKDLQKEFNYTIVFITHDLGVVANVADRVAVMYAGQIVELGKVEEVFFDPRHPYTWALLSSLPQLAQKNTVLYSITGTPPSLYNKIIGDPFAPRNPYCMKIDTLVDPPMFQVTETHFAKTWLLDPRAPKVEKPEMIHNIHEKLIEAFNI
ncbi:MAG: ATP-binding cassette domain-containing protein [Clostridiales bacterium]|nr:ATP-binding cassette domain-containing protein [Clostridiales bacterium]